MHGYRVTAQSRVCRWAKPFLGLDTSFDPDLLWPPGSGELDQLAKTKICLSFLHVIWLHWSCFECGFRPSIFTDAEQAMIQSKDWDFAGINDLDQLCEEMGFQVDGRVWPTQTIEQSDEDQTSDEEEEQSDDSEEEESEDDDDTDESESEDESDSEDDVAEDAPDTEDDDSGASADEGDSRVARLEETIKRQAKALARVSKKQKIGKSPTAWFPDMNAEESDFDEDEEQTSKADETYASIADGTATLSTTANTTPANYDWGVKMIKSFKQVKLDEAFKNANSHLDGSEIKQVQQNADGSMLFRREASTAIIHTKDQLHQTIEYLCKAWVIVNKSFGHELILQWQNTTVVDFIRDHTDTDLRTVKLYIQMQFNVILQTIKDGLRPSFDYQERLMIRAKQVIRNLHDPATANPPVPRPTQQFSHQHQSTYGNPRPPQRDRRYQAPIANQHANGYNQHANGYNQPGPPRNFSGNRAAVQNIGCKNRALGKPCAFLNCPFRH